eukprot:GFUD01038275.1.p1 GENE.GFUD01038275.1~~GFUD01038275.1.p1  ORF type:complete len:179 (-),score=58.19 GFUD01038275.1:110-646(-)
MNIVRMEFEAAPPPLTDSEHSEDESDTDSAYGSRTGNDDSDNSDSEENSPPPTLEPATVPKDSEELRMESNERFRAILCVSMDWFRVINMRAGLFMRADRERRRAGNDSDNNCLICLEDMMERDSRRLNPCNHKFHIQCIDNWLATPGRAEHTCPMCRHYIIQDNEFPDLGDSGHRRC